MKARFLALAALVLGLASCQTEPEGLNVNVGGEQDVTVCVSLPETTRANSAEGAFVNVDLTGNATIRYIMKIYDENNRPSDVRYVKYSDGNTVTFDVRLVPNRDYNFVVWADIVDGEADTDKHYNTTDLTNITLNDTWVAMDETRDAFTGVKFIEEYNGASTIDVKLTRPFAKLRVQTTDMTDLANLGITPTTATVLYTVDHYNAFNALEGKAIGDSKNRNIKHENINLFDENNLKYENGTLFVDYFFANNDVVKFELEVFDQNGALINKKHNFNTDIAAKRNHLTTIKGNILTEANNVEVEVVENGAFYEPENVVEYVEVNTPEQFEAALANPNVGGIVMKCDIETDGIKFDTPATRAAVTYNGRNVVIDGNGNTLTYNGAYGGRIIDFTAETNGASLSIKNLTIINNVSWIERAINYNTCGTLTLENVTIQSAEGCKLNYAINLPGSSDNAKVEIKGCNIEAHAQALNLWGEKTMVNVTNSILYTIDNSDVESYNAIALNNDGTNSADYSVINVSGGTLEVIGTHAEGSYTVRNNTVHGVVNVSETTVWNKTVLNPIAIIYWEGQNSYYSKNDLNAALEQAVPKYKATGVRMINDLTLPLAKKAIYGTPVAVQMKNGGVFDGCNNTLSVENPEYNAYVVETYGGTIMNLNITIHAGRGIIISSPKEDIYLDNVLVNGPGYALNTTEHNGKKLVVTNSTFKGWTSLAGLDSVSFTSCTFGENTYAYWQKNGYDQDYDRLIRPYVPTKFDSCVFENGFYVDLSALAADAKVTLKDCVCGEVKVTAENYAQYITIKLPADRTLADCVVFE